MPSQPRFLRPSSRVKLPRVLRGRGLIFAAGLTPVEVDYAVTLYERDAAVAYRGVLDGDAAGLKQLWQVPVATLRLKTGHRLEISVLETLGCEAQFESLEI